MVVVVKFDDTLDIDHRVTFWNGKRFVAEYPNAAEYARSEHAKRALDAALSIGCAGTIVAIEDYGLMSERVVTWSES